MPRAWRCGERLGAALASAKVVHGEAQHWQPCPGQSVVRLSAASTPSPTLGPASAARQVAERAREPSDG